MGIHIPLPRSAKTAIVFLYGMLVMLCAGLMYAYSSYSKILKEYFAWSQADIDLIGAMGNLFNFLIAFPSGLAVDKYGGHRVIVFSTSCTFFGFFMLYLATPPAHGLEPVFRLPPGAFGFFYGLVGFGCNSAYNCAMVPSLNNISAKHRGKVVGVLSTCFGISCALIVLIFLTAFGQRDVKSFYLFVSLMAVCVWLPGTIFLRKLAPPTSTVADVERVPLLREPTTTLVHFGTALNGSLPSSQPDSGSEPSRGSDIPLAAEQSAPRNTGDGAAAEKPTNTPEVVASPPPGDEEDDALAAHPIMPESARSPPSDDEEDDSPVIPPCCLGARCAATLAHWMPTLCGPKAPKTLAALREGPFWLLCFCFFVSTGCGLTIINHAGQLVPDEWRSVIVMLLSVVNACGRLSFGTLNDLLRGRLTGVQLYTIGASLMCLAHILLDVCLEVEGMVFFTCLLAAFAYGGMYSICPTIVSLWFGAENFGFNFGVVQLGTGLGGMALNVLIGNMVDSLGGFTYPLLMTSIVAGVGALCSVGLWRFHKRYSRATAATEAAAKAAAFERQFEEAPTTLVADERIKPATLSRMEARALVEATRGEVDATSVQ